MPPPPPISARTWTTGGGVGQKSYSLKESTLRFFKAGGDSQLQKETIKVEILIIISSFALHNLAVGASQKLTTDDIIKRQNRTVDKHL